MDFLRYVTYVPAPWRVAEQPTYYLDRFGWSHCDRPNWLPKRVPPWSFFFVLSKKIFLKSSIFWPRLQGVLEGVLEGPLCEHGRNGEQFHHIAIEPYTCAYLRTYRSTLSSYFWPGSWVAWIGQDGQTKRK